MPKRIQRKRTRGWRMPEGAVYVGRPSNWGNPFDWRAGSNDAGSPDWRRSVAVELFKEWLNSPWHHPEKPFPPSIVQIKAALAGHDLCCWCPLDQPCHADVLLEVAGQAGQKVKEE